MTQLHHQENPGLARFDFAVHDTAGRLTALVEARRRLGTNGNWAAQFRQNVLSHGQVPPSSLFMLIVPERLYVWHASAPADARPTHEVDAQSVFAPYFQRIGVRPEQIKPMAFEQLVAWWLEDVARGDKGQLTPELSRSGILQAIEGGNISHEAMV